MEQVYLVTGVTGNLGHTVANQLVKSGKAVIGLALPQESQPRLDPGVQIVRGDVRHPDTLEAFFQAAENRPFTLIHTAGIISIDPRHSINLTAVNVEGTRNVVKMARSFGVGRIIHTSSVHALPELDAHALITEESFDPMARLYGNYSMTKQKATAFLFEAMAEGLEATVVYPSGIVPVSDSKEGLVSQMVKDYLDHRLSVGIKGGYDFVDVRDVAEAMVKIAEHPHPAESYILSNRYYSVMDLMDCLYELTGLVKVDRTVPRFLVSAALPWISRNNRIHGRPQIFTRDSLHILNANANFSHQRADRDLGYHPREIRETLNDLLAELKGKHP